MLYFTSIYGNLKVTSEHSTLKTKEKKINAALYYSSSAISE